MAGAISRVTSSPIFLDTIRHQNDTLSDESQHILQQVIAEQIKHNFETADPEVRKVEFTFRQVPLQNAAVIYWRSILFDLMGLGCAVTLVAYVALGFFTLFIQKALVIAVIFSSSIAALASLYDTLLCTNRRFCSVVTYPSSTAGISLDEVTNEIDDITLEPFSEVQAPRHFLIGKRIVDLSSALTIMLSKQHQKGEIPHPFHNGSLTLGEKKKFIADLSNFLSVNPEVLEQCWQHDITNEQTEARQKALQKYQQKRFLELLPKASRAYFPLIVKNISSS